MALWKWKALDENGKPRRGVWEEKQAAPVIEHLRRQKLYPVSIKPSIPGTIALKFNARQAKTYWARNARKIAVLLEAGLPLLDIMDLIADKEGNFLRKNHWLRVRQRVLAGHDLSEGLKNFSPHPGFFLETMVRAGEKSGTLAECLRDAADQLDEEYYFEQKIKTALFYPLLLLIAALGIIYFLSIFILPMYETLFQSLDAELPMVTRILFLIGENMPLGLSLLILMIILGRIWFGQKKTWHFPGTGQIRRYKDLGQFCALFGRLLNAGLPLLESLTLLGEITKNPELSGLIAELRLKVKEGQRLSPVIARHKFFPAEAAKIIEVAEESGKMSEMLLYLAKMFRQELEEKLQQFNRYLEPVLVVGMAGVVGFVAISVLLPIFDIGTQIR
ncbi:MAG: type II secretion system F family protein [Desulfitobacteriia bacterium]|jgi:type IV pilus assembly protein PilC